MNNETAQEIAFTMKPKTIGLEIECYIPEDRESLINRELSAVVPYQRENWNTTTRRHWKGITDCSLNGNAPMGYVGREYVSPPLQPSQLFRQLFKVLEVLERNGVKVRKTCGLHVHCDAKGYTPKRLQYVINHAVKSEQAIDKMLAPSRRGDSPYSRSMRSMLDTAICQDTGRVRSGGEFRYRNVNLTAFDKHGTIEFRQHQGSLDFGKIVCWIALCQATTERCRLKIPRTESYQNPMHNVLIALKVATANIDGTIKPVHAEFRPVIQHVIERMHHFGFGNDAPVLQSVLRTA